MQSIFVSLKRLTIPLFVILMLVVLIFAINMRLNMTSDNIKQSSIQPTSRKCVPTPQPAAEIIGTSTPTPNGIDFNPLPKPAPSITPLPISKISDLAPGLADKDKAYIYVMHCDGSFELFKIKDTENLTNTLQLQPDDIIYNSFAPASLMGHQPPTYVAPMATSTSYSPAYPPPSSPSPTSRLTPYP